MNKQNETPIENMLNQFEGLFEMAFKLAPYVELLYKAARLDDLSNEDLAKIKEFSNKEMLGLIGGIKGCYAKLIRRLHHSTALLFAYFSEKEKLLGKTLKITNEHAKEHKLLDFVQKHDLTIESSEEEVIYKWEKREK